MKDWRDNEIEVGSLVVYSSRGTRGLDEMVEGIVERIEPDWIAVKRTRRFDARKLLTTAELRTKQAATIRSPNRLTVIG